MLHIQNLQAGYGGGPVLRGVDLKVEPGQCVCLMGRNGVGKSTLFKSIMGLIKPSSGAVSWNQTDITRTATDVRARSGIAYVPQGREIFPQMSVQENLELGLEARPRKKGEKLPDEVPNFIFDLFPMVGKMLHRKGGSLSGGQQQQLAICRALVANPKILLLDEPMEGIQPNVVQEIEGAIAKLKKEGEIAVLLIEQSLGFATTIADYSYVMDKGKIVAQGGPQELNVEEVQKYLTV